MYKLGVAFAALSSLIATPIMAADMAIKAPMAAPLPPIAGRVGTPG